MPFTEGSTNFLSELSISTEKINDNSSYQSRLFWMIFSSGNYKQQRQRPSLLNLCIIIIVVRDFWCVIESVSSEFLPSFCLFWDRHFLKHELEFGSRGLSNYDRHWSALFCAFVRKITLDKQYWGESRLLPLLVLHCVKKGVRSKIDIEFRNGVKKNLRLCLR